MISSRNMARLLSGRVGNGPSLEPPEDRGWEDVDARIAEMSFTEKRGLAYDYKDLIQGTPRDPGSFRKWLRERVADQLIAKAYDHNRSWY